MGSFAWHTRIGPQFGPGLVPVQLERGPELVLLEQLFVCLELQPAVAAARLAQEFCSMEISSSWAGQMAE